eukprot:5777519-Prymnesium_polylepis.1
MTSHPGHLATPLIRLRRSRESSEPTHQSRFAEATANSGEHTVSSKCYPVKMALRSVSVTTVLAGCSIYR